MSQRPWWCWHSWPLPHRVLFCLCASKCFEFLTFFMAINIIFPHILRYIFALWTISHIRQVQKVVNTPKHSKAKVDRRKLKRPAHLSDVRELTAGNLRLCWTTQALSTVLLLSLVIISIEWHAQSWCGVCAHVHHTYVMCLSHQQFMTQQTPSIPENTFVNLPPEETCHFWLFFSTTAWTQGFTHTLGKCWATELYPQAVPRFPLLCVTRCYSTYLSVYAVS